MGLTSRIASETHQLATPFLLGAARYCLSALFEEIVDLLDCHFAFNSRDNFNGTAASRVGLNLELRFQLPCLTQCDSASSRALVFITFTTMIFAPSSLAVIAADER